MKDMGTQCDIRTEKSTEFCVNCRSRENPGLATSDHGYSKIFQDIPSTSETDSIFFSSTPVKSAQCFSHTFESDELSLTQISLSFHQMSQQMSYQIYQVMKSKMLILLRIQNLLSFGHVSNLFSVC